MCSCSWKKNFFWRAIWSGGAPMMMFFFWWPFALYSMYDIDGWCVFWKKWWGLGDFVGDSDVLQREFCFPAVSVRSGLPSSGMDDDVMTCLVNSLYLFLLHFVLELESVMVIPRWDVIKSNQGITDKEVYFSNPPFPFFEKRGVVEFFWYAGDSIAMLN